MRRATDITGAKPSESTAIQFLTDAAMSERFKSGLGWRTAKQVARHMCYATKHIDSLLEVLASNGKIKRATFGGELHYRVEL